ncbi:hypothetical protein [Hymenobacter sp.]|uniref:hypothetical protein n=1 Tax=Hymenobacter sp. TaxID=1898978 RepID=UPI00286ABB8B|nr:hypothetical protein [Hymenobacter sp.]
MAKTAHLKRPRKTYHQQHYVFCDLLGTHLGGIFSFGELDGGMAEWGRFAKNIDCSCTWSNYGSKGWA